MSRSTGLFYMRYPAPSPATVGIQKQVFYAFLMFEEKREAKLFLKLFLQTCYIS